MLDKEKMRLYQKERRDGLRYVNRCKPVNLSCKPECKPDVKCKPNVNRVCKPDVNLPCESCSSLRLEIKKLIAENAMLKLQVEKKVAPAIVREDDFEHDGPSLPKYKPLGSSYKPNSLYGA